MTSWSSLLLKNSNLITLQFNLPSKIRKEIQSLSLLMKIWKLCKLSSKESNTLRSTLMDLLLSLLKKSKNLCQLKCLKQLRLLNKKWNKNQKQKKENQEVKEREVGDAGVECITDAILTKKKEVLDPCQATRKKNWWRWKVSSMTLWLSLLMTESTICCLVSRKDFKKENNLLNKFFLI